MDVLEEAVKLGLLDSSSSNETNRKRLLLASIDEPQQRRPRFREHRRNSAWDDYIIKARAVEDGYFMRRYKMTEETFDKLVHTLNLQVNEIKSKNSTRGIDMICPQIIVASGL